MEDEKVDKDYKDLFNLAYTLIKERNEVLYDHLVKLCELSPDFAKSDTYKALEAGKKQAEADLEREMDEMHRDDLKKKGGNNKDDITDDKRPPEKEIEPDDDREPPKPKARQTGLSEKQIKELEDYDAKEQDRAAKREFKEGTRRVNENTYENLQAHKLDEELKKEPDKDQQEKETFMKRFFNEDKPKGKDRDP